MNTIAQPREAWRAIIAVRLEKALPSIVEHANHVERQRAHHAPDEATVCLSLADDVLLTWDVRANDAEVVHTADGPRVWQRSDRLRDDRLGDGTRLPVDHS